MSKWITFDYKCADCGATSIEMVDRNDVPDAVPCACGSTANRQLTANITRVSYVDGNDRFRYAKEKRALDKMKRAARKAGQQDEVARISQEISNVQSVSKRDRRAENICKVSTPEK